MADIRDTVTRIGEANSWDQRIAQIRLIPLHHGTNEHPGIYAEIAKLLYVPHLAADFAYIHENHFYGREYFEQVYADAHSATAGFTKVTEDELTSVLENNPRTLLVFRTITGLRKGEFAHATIMAGEPIGLSPLSSGKVDAMERSGTATTDEQARVAARTLSQIIDGSLFGVPSGDLISKQVKPDTEHGWQSVRQLASHGVPFSLFLHQRHYGGSFRQVLDATSKKRGDLIEDAVESLFMNNGVPYIRTGSHNQGEIATRFEVRVTPAPDWARVNDALGPVVRDTDGRVFTLSTLAEMLEVAPFPSLTGLEQTH